MRSAGQDRNGKCISAPAYSVTCERHARELFQYRIAHDNPDENFAVKGNYGVQI